MPHCSMHPMCSGTCELVESVAPYPKTSTEELNQCGCHKRCPRGVPEAKQSCLHDLFGFFYRCRCHEHVSLLNLLHRIPEELSQSGCHKRCPRGVPEASEGGVEPTGGGEGGGALHMKFSRDAVIPRIPAPHLLKQGQLQLVLAFVTMIFGRNPPCYVLIKIALYWNPKRTCIDLNTFEVCVS